MFFSLVEKRVFLYSYKKSNEYRNTNMLRKNDEIELLEKWGELHTWLRAHLPIANSYVATDILFLVAIESRLKVKDLFTSLPHSYTAVRHHYKRLLEEQWIEQIADEKDKRVKYIQTTDKLNQVLLEFTQKIKNSPPPFSETLRNELSQSLSTHHRR